MKKVKLDLFASFLDSDHSPAKRRTIMYPDEPTKRKTGRSQYAMRLYGIKAERKKENSEGEGRGSV